MIAVEFSQLCEQMLRELGITTAMVRTTINDPHRALSHGGMTRLVAVHWLSDSQVVFVDANVTKLHESKTERRIEAVIAQLALALRPTLKAGSFDRSTDMETILAIVAESFGVSLRCHTDEPFSTLYSGPCRFNDDGSARVEVKPIPGKVTVVAVGSFQSDEKYAEFAWGLHLEKYQQWFNSLPQASSTAPIHGPPTIAVSFTPACQQLLPLTGITPAMVCTTINDPHCRLVDEGCTRLAAAHWFSDSRIVLVDAAVMKKQGSQPDLRIEAVAAQLVLELRPALKAGNIDRSMDMETILAILAESFGAALRCHTDEPFSTLYSGPARFLPDGQPYIGLREPLQKGGLITVSGSFHRDNKYARLTWVLHLKKYRDWFRSLPPLAD